MSRPSVKERLDALRAELKSRNLDGFVVPLTDEHQSEYVASYAHRLAWLTDFQGSFGMAIILKDKAAVFSDGRYTLQMADQVDQDYFETHTVPDTKALDWVLSHINKGTVIGFDPFLHTIGWEKEWRSALEAKGVQLRPVDSNPVDAVWTDQPDEPNTPVTVYEEKYAGLSSSQKRENLGKAIADKGADAAVLSMLDSIAWLFNIRSDDVRHTPVSLAFATLDKDGVATLYLNPSKVSSELKSHLGNEVEIRDKATFLKGLEEMGQVGQKVLADPDTASFAIFRTLEKAGAQIIKAPDPCALPKAMKNEAELTNTKAAHIRDGAVITRLLNWLSKEGPAGILTELDVVGKLYAMREEDPLYRGPSFDTIAGAGPNGAIVHYRVSEKTNRSLEPDSVFLCDSGGQYLDGTTDITRTVAIGQVPDEVKDRYTRVLKGHIALATAHFPEGTTGPALDTFARAPLWEGGFDYDHGTGHGVGVFLAVHEGPGRISKASNSIALKPGMIFSNEPGYYKAGAYGIRIENLVIVRSVDVGGDRPTLGFETITFAPLDRHMIKKDLLTKAEQGWVNQYHARVREKLMPLLSGDDQDFLIRATEPL